MSKLFSVIFLVAIVGCSTNKTEYKAKVQDPEFLHRTIKQITDRIVYDIFSPPVASRIYAYTSIAGYEALRHQDPTYLSLAGQVKGLQSQKFAMARCSSLSVLTVTYTRLASP